MRSRSFLMSAAVLCLLPATAIHASPIPEWLISSSIKSLNATERAARGGMTVSLWVILFYIFYLGTIWAFNVSMFFSERHLPEHRRRFAKYFCRANIFLASGDTAMFLAFLTAYLFPSAFEDPAGTQKLFQLLLLGVFTTSITMSIYYFYIGLYYRERFASGAWNLIVIFVLIFFVIRLAVHYNPDNIWFSMMLPPGQPNYSAWLRNIPLFIYGLCVIATVWGYTWKTMPGPERPIERNIARCNIGAMVALLFSFAMYALDVFYSHKIPHDYIWIVYTLKTLAYMVAFVLMWLGEFHFGRRLDQREPHLASAENVSAMKAQLG